MNSSPSGAGSAMSMAILGGTSQEGVRRRKNRVRRRHQQMTDSLKSKIGGEAGVMEGRESIRKDLENP